MTGIGERPESGGEQHLPPWFNEPTDPNLSGLLAYLLDRGSRQYLGAFLLVFILGFWLSTAIAPFAFTSPPTLNLLTVPVAILAIVLVPTGYLFFINVAIIPDIPAHRVARRIAWRVGALIVFAGLLWLNYLAARLNFAVAIAGFSNPYQSWLLRTLRLSHLFSLTSASEGSYLLGALRQFKAISSICLLGTLYYALRDLWTVAPPLLQMRLGYQPPDNSTLAFDLAHWSDLHLTARGAATLEGKPGGSETLLWLVHQEFEVLSRVGAILVTGDMTDTGSAGDWKTFFDIVPAELLSKMTIVPGNHDLNIVGGKYVVEGDTGFLQTLRLIRNILAIDRVQETRAKIICGGKLVSVRRLVDGYRESLEGFAIKPPSLKDRHAIYAYEINEKHQKSGDALYVAPRLLWRDLFPMAVEYADLRTVIVVLDTNRLAGNIVTNAFGTVSEHQLDGLHNLLSYYANWRQILAIHHHVALPPFDQGWISSIQARGLALDNGHILAATLPNDRGRVIFHGHRHIEYHGTMGEKLQIVSAPSTTLGDEVTRRTLGGFYVYPIFSDGEWSTYIGKPEWRGFYRG